MAGQASINFGSECSAAPSKSSQGEHIPESSKVREIHHPWRGFDSTTQRQWAERAVRAVDWSFPPSEVETWPTCQLYLPHALVCADHIAQWDLATAEAASLLFQAAYYLNDRGQYEQAEPHLQRALTTRERVRGAEHPDTLGTVNNLALLYWKQGKYEQAEPLYQRALTTSERVLGPEHPDTVRTRENYTKLLQQMKKRAQAADSQSYSKSLCAQHID